MENVCAIECKLLNSCIKLIFIHHDANLWNLLLDIKHIDSLTETEVVLEEFVNQIQNFRRNLLYFSPHGHQMVHGS
jgi:prolyl oligopeptidase PreP (S9A serine peptidase family)